MFHRKNSVIIILTVLFLFFVNIDVSAIPARIIGSHSYAPDLAGKVIAETVSPSPYMIIPFLLLLLMIATGPIFYMRFWDGHYAKISIVLGMTVAGYYLFALGNYKSVLGTLTEYISFIVLLSALFVVSGGIHIKVDKKATPMLNVVFLLFGAVIANVIGTTGASMLLIRPFIRLNKNRIKPYHIIFFIFLVSNIGGALTPIGTPLFLGFLSGVPFYWVAVNVWYIWMPALLLLLIIFYFYDISNKKGTEEQKVKEYTGKVEIKGSVNFIYFAVIIAAVFIDPAIFHWVPDFSPFPVGIREIILLAVVLAAYKQADKKVLRDNEFDFEPIKEVGYLFFGIFATMIPAVQLIADEAHTLGNKLNAGIFYWASGSLSAALDNTPTYMNFLSAAMGKYGLDVTNKAHVIQFINADGIYLKAISVASVFFGALTYIGNGPNFMVKSLSERAGIEMPGFFAYIIKYSLIILVPVLIIIWLLFFYGMG